MNFLLIFFFFICAASTNLPLSSYQHYDTTIADENDNQTRKKSNTVFDKDVLPQPSSQRNIYDKMESYRKQSYQEQDTYRFVIDESHVSDLHSPNQQLALSRNNVNKTNNSNPKSTNDACETVRSQHISEKKNSDSYVLAESQRNTARNNPTTSAVELSEDPFKVLGISSVGNPLQIRKRMFTHVNEASNSKAATTPKKQTVATPKQCEDTELISSQNNVNDKIRISQKENNASNALFINTANTQSSWSTPLNAQRTEKPARYSQLVKNKKLRCSNANSTQSKVASTPTESVFEGSEYPYIVLDSNCLPDEQNPVKRLQAKKRTSTAAKKPNCIKKTTEQETVKKEPAKWAIAKVKPTTRQNNPYSTAEFAALEVRRSTSEFNDLVNWSYRRQTMHNHMNEHLRSRNVFPEANHMVQHSNPMANNTVSVAENLPAATGNSITLVNTNLIVLSPSNNMQSFAAIDHIQQNVNDSENYVDENAAPTTENISDEIQLTSNRQFVTTLRKNDGPFTSSTHRNSNAQLMAKRRAIFPVQNSGESKTKIMKLDDQAKMNVTVMESSPRRENISQINKPTTGKIILTLFLHSYIYKRFNNLHRLH